MDLNSIYDAETPIIWRGEYHFPDDIIDVIKEDIIAIPEAKRDYESEEGDIYSTYYIENVFKRPEVILLDTYKQIMTQIALEMNFVDSDFSLDYWCQIYDGSHYRHMHYSGMIPYSFVHFVRPTEEKCFYFAGHPDKKYYPKQDKGDIIVFPSMALHGIDASYGAERITMAGNLMFSNVRTPGTDVWCRISEIRKGLYVTEHIFNGSN